MNTEIIKELIDLKQEGEYWDFKKEWYSKEQKLNLLHDIISMANNLTENDGLIIIGVDESDDYKVKDVKKDSNRRNTQNIVDFLKDKKFAGDTRPIVKVESIMLQTATLDIIVIKNSNFTPYYLKENYIGNNKGKILLANYIYTRIQDSNTPINQSADLDKVEKLWKKRFGIDKTALEKLKLYITQYDNWTNGPHGEMEKFHKIFPEFTITYDFLDISNPRQEFYMFSQMDSTPQWMTIQLKYFSTLLLEFSGVSLDGGRYFTPCPQWDDIEEENFNEISFKYMEKDSIIYKLNEFFYYIDWSREAQYSRDRFPPVVLLFENEQERIEFKKFISLEWQNKDTYIGKIRKKTIQCKNEYNPSVFEEQYNNGLILNRMLEVFRDGTYNKFKN